MDDTPQPAPHNFSEYGKRGGRPKYRPTTKLRREIEAFASYGIPEPVIARVFGIPYSTMRKHYRDELELGHAKTNAQVAGFLFNAAKKGNVAAMTFWLKCRAGWVDASAAAAAAIGKKEAALVAARQPDIGSPFGRVIAARAERSIADVGSELRGLDRPADEWPVAHSRSAA